MTTKLATTELARLVQYQRWLYRTARELSGTTQEEHDTAVAEIVRQLESGRNALEELLSGDGDLSK